MTGHNTDDELEGICTEKEAAWRESLGKASVRIAGDPVEIRTEYFRNHSVTAALVCGSYGVVLLRWHDRNIEPLTAISNPGSDVTNLVYVATWGFEFSSRAFCSGLLHKIMTCVSREF
jgi:hypothetical protein